MLNGFIAANIDRPRDTVADKFEDLRTYVAIVESGGVNAAAAKLELARSAASRRLSDLEQRLGVVLIQRTTRTFELTEVGRSFYKESRRILEDIAAIEGRLRNGDDNAEGLITVAIERSLTTLLMPAVAAFRARNPAVRISIDGGVGDADASVLVITSGRIDPKRRSIEIGRYRSGVQGSPAYLHRARPLNSPADLAEHDGIIVAEASPSDWLFGSGLAIRPQETIMVPDAFSAMSAAIAGLGIAHLPTFLTEAAVRAGDLAACLVGYDTTSVISASKPEQMSADVDALVDHLIAGLAKRA